MFVDDDMAGTAAQRHVQVKDRRAQAELALYESRKELRRLAGLLCTIQEDEKRRIALDLHDGLGQTLTLIKLSMENILHLAESKASEAVVESLREVVPRIKDALAEVHRVAMELRPPMLDDLGVLPTLSWFLREYESACAGVTVDKAINIAEQDVPGPLKITLFRIVQEATSNIVKHAGATRVRISLNRCDEVLHMLIEDNGCGFEPAKVACSDNTGRGLGLLSLKERTSHSGGIHQLDSAPGQGTRHQFWWPCEQAV
ncbi:MAG: sensor histidine kinase [Thiobacillus sp.]|nr:sensor histidine kinase [Thiobacillus sp.]